MKVGIRIKCMWSAVDIRNHRIPGTFFIAGRLHEPSMYSCIIEALILDLFGHCKICPLNIIRIDLRHPLELPASKVELIELTRMIRL